MRFSLLSNIPASSTVRMNSLALAKKAAGERVYNLSAGEPMVPAHPLILEAAKRALDEGRTHYPPVAGIPELRSAAVSWMAAFYQASYTPAQCLVTCGGKFGIYAVCQALLNPGDEVIIISPYWVSYPAMVQLFGGVPKIIPTEESNGWKANPQRLAAAISPATKLLILNNASNPTGALYTKEELRAIMALCAERGVTALSDEVYSGLVYDQKQFVSCGAFSEFKDHLIIIQSCSKHFALTGLRVGLVFAPEPLIKILANLQSQSTTGTASISQYAAVGAFKNAETIMPEVRNAMQKRRDVLLTALDEFFHVKLTPPPSGLYAFVSMSSLGVDSRDSVKWCEQLIERGSIAAVPGASFGQEGYARFSFGAEEKELQEAVKALRDSFVFYS